MKHQAHSLCAAILLISITGNLSAQYERLPGKEKQKLHQEIPSGSYSPNAFGNKKVSPAYKSANSGLLIATGSNVFTTQVNINGSGQNIIGDAANEPSIAVSPVNQNEIVIGWRQFDDVNNNFRQAGYAYSSDTGQTWTFPGVIEPGIFRSDPVLDVDANGQFYYNSLTNSPTFLCKVFRSNNGGATWDAGVDAGGGDKQWMTIDRTGGTGNGHIYSSWTQNFSSCLPGFFTRSTDGGNSYESCIEVDSNPYWLTMAVGVSGELILAGGHSLPDSIVVVKSTNANVAGSVINWYSPVMVFMDGNLNGWTNVNPVGLLGQVNVDVDRSSGPGQGNIYVLATLTRISNGDPGDVMFARSIDGGITWSPPVRINDDPSNFTTQWFGTMSVAPNGRIDAVWLDTREDAFGLDSSALYYSYSYDQGITWSVNEKISPLFDPHIGYPMQDKMGDYYDMVSDSAGAHLAWAATFNSEQDVYYSYIVPPVNTGVPEFSSNAIANLYPDPAQSVINIKCNPSTRQVEIVNLLGETVIQKSNMSRSSLLYTTLSIDINSLASGVYFVKAIQLDGSCGLKKFIKN